MKRTTSTALTAGFVLVVAAQTVLAGEMPPVRRLPPLPCRVTAPCQPAPVPCNTSPTRRDCQRRLPPIGRR